MWKIFGKRKEQGTRRKLEVGHRIHLSGGYDMEPEWLGGGIGYFGQVVAFIPGQNKEPAAVVELDSPIEAAGAVGKFVVLELRYVEAKWEEGQPVHVELCDFMPESKRWQDRRQGKWVESHASHEIIA
jgi:hypothetical protein